MQHSTATAYRKSKSLGENERKENRLSCDVWIECRLISYYYNLLRHLTDTITFAQGQSTLPITISKKIKQLLLYYFPKSYINLWDFTYVLVYRYQNLQTLG